MLRACLALALLATTACAGGAPRDVRRPPNVVLIVADDLGYAELGGEIPTPHLDRLAAAGVRCTAGYVTASLCSPSRAALLTGRYQQRFGHEINPVEATNDRPEVGLPTSERTLADLLRDAGHATGMVGKWHLGNHPPYFPRRRGFDDFFGFLREGRYYTPPPFDAPPHRFRPREPDYNRLNPMLRGETEVEEPRYLTDAFGAEAAAFIDRRAGRPFFLYLPFNAPHSPMQATPDAYARFASIADPHRRVFAAMVASLDDAVGRVLDALRRHGLERDTLVVFLSDNGGPTAELTSRNAPFSGGKGQVLEGGVRVPFLVSWPGRLPAGRVYDRPVSALDVLPTALAAVGRPLPPGLDGVDLLPFLAGERAGDPHEALYWRMSGAAAIRAGRWKLQRSKAEEPFKLHDLDADPAESRDLAGVEPDRARALAARWTAWNAELVEPRWRNEPPRR
jgi:arylsulfatase A-like enzyme